MHFDLRPFLYLWIVLAAVVVVLFAWRQSIAKKEDDTIDVLQSAAPPQQAFLAQKLEHVDKWGKLITIIAAVYAVVLGALYIYQGLVSPSTFGA